MENCVFFEDWREDIDTRATALAEVLSVDQIAGLICYLVHMNEINLLV
jgi:hypothetical protein